MSNCTNCGSVLKLRQKKFCSIKCQMDYQYKDYIKLWGKGFVDGNRGINTKNVSNHLKRYLGEKFGNKCCLCGWSVRHSTTGCVPLEIDHIDGNAENNSDSNLRLLCPNCHALTPLFRKLNKNGRKWRRDKYLKII